MDRAKPCWARPLVIGGSGMLGQAVVGMLRAAGIAAVVPSRGELDLTAAESLSGAVEALRPTALLNLAAFSDVGRAEIEACRGELLQLNVEAPRRLAEAGLRLGVPFVHISTDFVFDGSKRAPYSEEDPAKPLQAYGWSKLEGERAVRTTSPGALIVRVSTLFGPGPRVRPHYVDAILAQARRSAVLEVVRLPVSSPTYTPDAAEALAYLLDVGATGTVHFANSGECSRLELARAASELAGFGERVRIDERAAPRGALRRPDYSVLDTGRYRRLTGRSPRHWRAALADYVERRGR